MAYTRKWKTALAYYSVKSLTDYFAKRDVVAKFYFIVDRIDLMEQATDEFAARGLVVHNAKSRDELMKDISSRSITHNNEGKLEIMVVNIQNSKKIRQKSMSMIATAPSCSVFLH